MLAEMHHGVGVEMAPDPEIERQIMVRRHQIGIVIGALGVNIVTARRLHADHHVAETMQTETKAAAHDMRVLRRPPPARLDGASYVLGQFREAGFIVGQAP